MEHQPYHLYGRRWLMLLLGLIINFSVIAVEQPLTPSASVAARYLGVSIGAIHWLKYAWSITAAVTAIPGLLLLERVGLRKTGVLCTVALLVGVSLRCAELATSAKAGQKSTWAYTWVLLGSIVGSIGVIPIQSATTFISASWFDDAQRGLANTLVRGPCSCVLRPLASRVILPMVMPVT
jgi:hypothetical protein